MRKAAVLAAGALLTLTVGAREWWVDHEKGDDANPGTRERPFRTFARSRQALRGGETLHVVPTATPYDEPLGWFNMKDHSGTPERPTVVDGHGAKLTGMRSYDANAWTNVGDNVWATKIGHNVVCMSGLGHYNGFPFIKLDGRFVPMRGSCAELGEGEAFFRLYWDSKAQKHDADHGKVFLKLPAGRKPADFKIEMAQLSNLRCYCNHIVFRDLHGDWVSADVFDTERGEGIVFDNVSTDHCMDQGISSHSTRGCTVMNSHFRNAICGGALDVTLGPNEYQNMVYTNCLFDEMHYGIATGASFKGTTNMFYRVSGCTARNCDRYGFETSQGANVVIEDTRVENPGLALTNSCCAYTVTDDADVRILRSSASNCKFAVRYVWGRRTLVCEDCDFTGARNVADISGPRKPGAVVFRRCRFARDAKVFLDHSWQTPAEAEKKGIGFEDCTFESKTLEEAVSPRFGF